LFHILHYTIAAQASAQLNAALQPCSHVGVVKYANVLWPYIKCNNAVRLVR